MAHYIVIADYPGSHLAVGDKLEYWERKYRKLTAFGYVAFKARYLDQYPHLFKRIET